MEKQNKRQVYNRLSEMFDFEGTFEECYEYLKKHDNGYLEITFC